MVERSIILTIQTYLDALVAHGIPIAYGVLFGSYARNTGLHQWSDIDVLVVSSRYDESYSRADITLLWKIAARTDSRIEPIPVGIHRWHTDDGSTILEIARREGVVIPLFPRSGTRGEGMGGIARGNGTGRLRFPFVLAGEPHPFLPLLGIMGEIS